MLDIDREPQLHAALFFAENLRFALRYGMIKKIKKQKAKKTRQKNNKKQERLMAHGRKYR